MTEIKRIHTRDELVALANVLVLRPDWHEPGERDVTAAVRGKSFDNSGLWGAAETAQFLARYSESPTLRAGARGAVELWVTLYEAGEPVAEVNLATLFAFACGFEG